MRRSSWSALAKLQLLFLTWAYTNGAGDSPRPEQTLDPTTGCWLFEGPSLPTSNTDVRAAAGWMAYGFESGTQDFLYATHLLISLDPRGWRPESNAQSCERATLDHSWHWDLYGRFNLSVIERVYADHLRRYSLRKRETGQPRQGNQ